MNAWAVLGLAIMVVSEAATLAGFEPFYSWNTPICWTGFILCADSVVWRARGDSWLRSAPGEFAFLAGLSIPLWLVFEFYNVFIENWFYVGLPERQALRLFGYAWAFATIWPAIFEGAELIAVVRSPRGSLPTAGRHGRGHALFAADAPRNPLAHLMMIMMGAVMLAWPIVWPSPYLAAPVFLGFIFLLDPINARAGRESLVADWKVGRTDRLFNLIFSGVLCGILWEFWNYWSGAKWHYTVPIMEDFKLFEMPLPGYFGFPAFALECFTMYVFVRGLTGHRFTRALGI